MRDPSLYVYSIYSLPLHMYLDAKAEWTASGGMDLTDLNLGNSLCSLRGPGFLSSA